jgi:hypothetical protein
VGVPSFRPGLGRVQRGILVRLSRHPDGLTVTDLDDLPAGRTRAYRRASVWDAAARLERQGLAAAAGRVPAGTPTGRGAPRVRWRITQAGLDLVAKGGLR